MSYDMYLYGMILRTNSFLLEGDYPEADTYAEIRKKYSLPGGETGTARHRAARPGAVGQNGRHLYGEIHDALYKEIL